MTRVDVIGAVTARGRRLRWLAGLLATFCVLGAQGALAASFQSKSFDELVSEAEQVFIGTMAGSSSRYTDRGVIVTDYRFDVTQSIKGPAPTGPMTITMLGGKVGQVELSVSGAPTFHSGIRYLVFEAGNGTVAFPVVGGSEGIFQIRSDPGSGTLRVYDYNGNPVTELPQRSSAAQQQPAGSPPPAGAAASPQLAAPAALSLDAFEQAIRSRLKP